ncbi:vWA domain-containing protein [Deinococcus aestuarii]|uniref:vWA domain-containing protein n=1 Tax=Deinococcus aestuarii TaxID=2774531 RepID=UPI001C0C1589|nr:VWA domain-containing protein [Deinococcus aestuarii]
MTHPAPLPRVELLPLRPALPAGQATELPVLARLHPAPAPQASEARPPLNLALVIDRSGSMDGRALRMARLATQVALRALAPHDRVSVVTFDHTVQTLLPPQPVTDPEALCAEIDAVTAGGATALHAGWLEGALLAAQHHDPRALNRVLLLSDGRANRGETRPDVIAGHVRALTARGVGTSTVGLGRSYDEDLLRAMADAGDGNYEHIEDEAALPGFFAAELHGLTRTTGHTVSLGVEPNPALGQVRTELLNDLPATALGRRQLPNLVAGHPVELVFTLQVPAQPPQPDLGLTRVRLAWTGRDGVRRRVRAQLSLPVISPEVWAALPENAQVRVAEQLLRAAWARRDAVGFADRGAVERSRETLVRQRGRLQAYAASPAVAAELDALEALDLDFASDVTLARKRALSQSYDRSRSKPQRGD